jgi:hypothetical protein
LKHTEKKENHLIYLLSIQTRTPDGRPEPFVEAIDIYKVVRFLDVLFMYKSIGFYLYNIYQSH